MNLASVKWWQRGVVYQIYPRSFRDTNGDGIGDLKGIAQKLDYLAWLGADIIWLSPIYPSPMMDFGYDVSNYSNVDRIFGTLADIDEILIKAHGLGMKVLLDFVPNHTSDQHPWFLESRSTRQNPKRDWYIWHDSKQGEPPNNWLSEFGGPAWTLDPVTNQFYYHAYLPSQPDLNWRNADVRAAMKDAMRFWLDLGIDGFRLDTIEHLLEDAALQDNPTNPAYRPSQPITQSLLRTFTTDQPEIGSVLQELRAVTDAYTERLLIGETYLPMERAVKYVNHGIHLPFNFELLRTAWTAIDIAKLITRYESLLPPGAWPNWVLGNHDRARIASRIGPHQARVAAMLLLTLRGTPTLYYGDEIGLTNVPIPPEHVQDPWERNMPGLGFGRDPVRTPMPWDASPNAGFSDGTPWLPLNHDWRNRNVAAQRENPRSLLCFYRRLLELRRVEPALALGSYGAISADGDVLKFERRFGDQIFLICLNFDAADVETTVTSRGQIIVSTEEENTAIQKNNTLKLRANEGVVLRLS